MKLLFCPSCQDVKKLEVGIAGYTLCTCGKSFGRYEADGLHAVYCGKAVPLGFDNPSLTLALSLWKHDHGNHMFQAFTIPDTAPTIKRFKKKSKKILK